MAQTFYPITPTEIVASAANQWVTMDASAVGVPEGATGVILHIVNTYTGDFDVGVRKNGSTDNRTSAFGYPMGKVHCWAMIGVDASRYFEAYVENTTYIDIYVVGYTMAGVTFKTNADDKSPSTPGSWQPIDCSTEAEGAIGLIFEIDLPASDHYIGLRKNGSSDDRYNMVGRHSCLGAIIGCDASQICEGYIQYTGYDFIYLVGYITDGCTFNTNADDVSLDSTAEWLDLSALPSGANMGFIEIVSSPARKYGLRKDGSGEDIYYDTYMHAWGIVECASLIIEGKIESTGLDFFVVGYSTVVLGWSGKVSGVTDPAKVMGVDVANINKVKGVASA